MSMITLDTLPLIMLTEYGITKQLVDKVHLSPTLVYHIIILQGMILTVAN